MDESVREAKYAFSVALSTALNKVVTQIPTDVPYRISHFFTAYPADMCCQMVDGRTLAVSYETKPDIENNTLNVAMYFETPLYLNPIIQIPMDIHLITLYKKLIEQFIEVRLSKEEIN